MIRSNAVMVKVKAPTLGLQTRIPSNNASPDHRAIVIAENVRAERGVLRNAPGYERIVPSPRNLDTPANLLWQANLLDPDREIQTTPFVGTATSLYTMRRRSQALVCDVGGAGRSCTLTAAFLGDSGTPGANLEGVADLIKSRVGSKGIVVHVGDSVYDAPPLDPHVSKLEQCVGQYFGPDFIGGYSGTYGFGPPLNENRFFPCLGNHDWDDLGIANYRDFYRLDSNYYTFKRGPVHFIVYSGYAGTEPDGTALGSTQATWLAGVLAASDCPHIVFVVHFPLWTSDIEHYPGDTSLQTLAPLLVKYGAVVVSGHAHDAEILGNSDVPTDTGTGLLVQLISGTGGNTLRGFHSPLSPYSEWTDNSDYGALFLTADRDTMTFEWVTQAGVSLHTFSWPAQRAGSGICYVGDAAKDVFTLQIVPDEATVEVGHSWPYRAYAHYVDGTSEEVTGRCTWTSDDSVIGTVGANTGLAVGNSPGDATITATYLDQSDTAIFHVLHSCLDDPTEVVFVVDRSAAMGAAAGDSTKLENIKTGIVRSLDGFDDTRDFLSLASFGGDFDTQIEDATINPVLTSSFESVQDALSLLVPFGSRGVASGLDLAYTELVGVRHVSGNHRAAVLIVGGPAEVVSGGDSSSEATAIATGMAAAVISANNIKTLTATKLVVIGYDVDEAYQSSVQALATTGYYFRVDTADDLIATLAGLANLFCVYDDYYYYHDQPCNYPEPDFFGLSQWDVVRGCVDLAGAGPNGEASTTAWDPRPGNGFYLDLVGTNPNLSPAHNTTSAKIQTKSSISFVIGKTYRLSFYLCNYDQRVSTTQPYVDVSITNGIVPATRYQPAVNGPFVQYTIDFTVTSAKSGKVVFDHQLMVYNDRVGLLLDRVEVRNMTDSVRMFYDDFDSENPCSI